MVPIGRLDQVCEGKSCRFCHRFPGHISLNCWNFQYADVNEHICNVVSVYLVLQVGVFFTFCVESANKRISELGHFTAPNDSPCTRRFCANMNTASSGKQVITASAISRFPPPEKTEIFWAGAQ